MSSFRYFVVAIISRVYYPNTFDIVEKGMNVGYRDYTVALAVLLKEVHVAADATKFIL